MKVILECEKLRPKMVKGGHEDFMEKEIHDWIKLLVRFIVQDINSSSEHFFQNMFHFSQGHKALEEMITAEVCKTFKHRSNYIKRGAQMIIAIYPK